MAVPAFYSLILDPTGYNLEVCSDRGVIRATEDNQTYVRTFNDKTAVSGRNRLDSFEGQFFSSWDDYRRLERLVLEKRREEIVIYNFAMDYSELNATRTFYVVPSQENPNPHITEETDNGDGRTRWTYFRLQQGYLQQEKRSRRGDLAFFDLAFTEATLRYASEET